jgi:hypothetical protein
MIVEKWVPSEFKIESIGEFESRDPIIWELSRNIGAPEDPS